MGPAKPSLGSYVLPQYSSPPTPADALDVARKHRGERTVIQAIPGLGGDRHLPGTGHCRHLPLSWRFSLEMRGERGCGAGAGVRGGVVTTSNNPKLRVPTLRLLAIAPVYCLPHQAGVRTH